MNQKISPRPSLPRGIIPPFGKGRLGGILKINVLIILRLLMKFYFNFFSVFFCNNPSFTIVIPQFRVVNASAGVELITLGLHAPDSPALKG